ncbi:MAG: hypothetical protein ACE5H0_06640 [Bacteroidota bacterium]
MVSLVLFVSLLFGANSSAAQWTVSLYVGKSRTSPSDLEIGQPSLLNDLTFHNLSYSDESFKTPFYYGVRVGYFFQEPKFIGLEVEFVLVKVLTNPEEIVHMTGKWKGQPEDESFASVMLLNRFP